MHSQAALFFAVFLTTDLREPDAYETLADRELQAIVLDTLQNLDEKQRLVLTLYYFEELNLKEIGKVLGIGESRVCQLQAQALIRLKGKLRKEELTR